MFLVNTIAYRGIPYINFKIKGFKKNSIGVNCGAGQIISKKIKIYGKS